MEWPCRAPDFCERSSGAFDFIGQRREATPRVCRSIRSGEMHWTDSPAASSIRPCWAMAWAKPGVSSAAANVEPPAGRPGQHQADGRLGGRESFYTLLESRRASIDRSGAYRLGE